MKAEKITIGIINHNGIAALPATLRALQALQYPAYEIMMVDNGSTDGSLEWVQKYHPEVRCICLGENLGLPGARNVILKQATTDYVFIMDNDISVEPDVLTTLMQVMQQVPQAGACHPEMKDVNDPTVHHYNGGWIHYLGTHISRSRPDRSQMCPPYEKFDVVSGGALLIRREMALKIGGFDADYFFNWEDGDFTARMTLAGYSCLNVPAAVVHHRSKPRGTSKIFYQVRNRWYFMLKLYAWHTLFLIAPMLLLFELLLALFLLKKGAIVNYWRGNLAVIKDLPTILVKRRAFQKIKKVRDRDWLRIGQMYVPPQLHQPVGIMDMLQQVFHGIFNVYWRIVSSFC